MFRYSTYFCLCQVDGHLPPAEIQHEVLQEEKCGICTNSSVQSIEGEENW